MCCIRLTTVVAAKLYSAIMSRAFRRSLPVYTRPLIVLVRMSRKHMAASLRASRIE